MRSTAENIAEQFRTMLKQIHPNLNSFIDASFVFMKNNKVDYKNCKLTHFTYSNKGANNFNKIGSIAAEPCTNESKFKIINDPAKNTKQYLSKSSQCQLLNSQVKYRFLKSSINICYSKLLVEFI